MPPKTRFKPEDFANFQASGLRYDQLALAGWYSTHGNGDAADVKAKLNLGQKSTVGEGKGGTMIPIHGLKGELLTWVYRPTIPIVTQDGRTKKYVFARGGKVAVYLGVKSRVGVTHPDEPVHFCEGVKNQQLFEQEGFTAIGLLGVSTWNKPGTVEPNDTLAAINWRDRDAFIHFDNDPKPKSRQAVNWEATKLAAALRALGAREVYRVVYPPEVPGGKGSPDTFIPARGLAAFHQLLKQAKPVEPEVNAAPADPHRLAGVVAADHQQDGVPTLTRYQGQWLEWHAGAYRARTLEDVNAEVVRAVKEELDRHHKAETTGWLSAQREGGKKGSRPVVLPVTTGLITNVMNALASLLSTPSTVSVPGWLGDDQEPAPVGELLVGPNGMTSLADLAAGTAELLPATPRLFTTTALDYPIDPRAKEPVQWLAFLDQLWPDDQEAKDTLQDVFGYLLSTDTSQQKIFALVGPTRSGKGTICRVLRRLVGADNVASPTLASLATNFGLMPLVGKSMANISDARMPAGPNVATVTERLLSISGEDALTVDRKYLSPVHMKLLTRFLICTNELPRFIDSSGALANRMVIIRLKQSFLGREDPALTDKLLTELPGILLWAAKGWARLKERGRFVVPASSADLVQTLEDLSSPISSWLRDCCSVGPDYQDLVADLYASWCGWCEEQGQKYTGTVASFGRDLHAALPDLQTTQPRTESGRLRQYRGLARLGIPPAFGNPQEHRAAKAARTAAALALVNTPPRSVEGGDPCR